MNINKIKSILMTCLIIVIAIYLLVTKKDVVLHQVAPTLGITSQSEQNETTQPSTSTALVPVENTSASSLGDIPEFTNQPYVVLNNNVPLFTDEEKKTDYAFEVYSDLDNLGRCGVAYANICPELMPDEDREGIGSVKPSGWINVKYKGLVDGGYLYNRCHLIGFQLAGENANKLNLITGTRYLNMQGMLPFENEVAEYVKKTGNHVLYRVTPIFKDSELVCRGLTMEAYSVEDNGEGVQFYVYCYNNQPYITIDYSDGSSYVTSEGKNN